MKFAAISAVLLCLVASPQVFGQELRLSEALYYDCEVRQADEGEFIELDISYIIYQGKENQPQHNFKDPDGIIYKDSGWRRSSLALSQRTADHDHFLWLMDLNEGRNPTMRAELEIMAQSGIDGRFKILLRRFDVAQTGSVSVQYTGECTTVAGAEAYYRFAGKPE